MRVYNSALPLSTSSVVIRLLVLGVIVIALVSAAAQAQTEVDTQPAQLATERMAESDSLDGIAAEGALLYSNEAVKLDGYQYCSQAIALADKGEFRLSIRAASKALHVAQATNNEDLQALADRDLAIAYSYSGHLDEAERFANEALKHQAKDPKIVIGPVRKILGDVQSRRHDYPAAIAAYQGALDASSERFKPLVRASLANAYIDAGDPILARSALDAIPEQTDPALKTQLGRTRGRLLLAEQKPDAALALYTEMVRAPTARDSDYARFWAYEGIARSDLALDHKTDAASAYDQAVSSIDAVRAQFRSEEVKMGLFADVQSVFEQSIDLDVDLGDARRAFEISEHSRARALLDAVRGRTGTLKTDSPTLLTLPALQALLKPDERVVEFHSLHERLLIWVIGPDSIKVTVLPIGRSDLTQLVEAFRSSIINGKRAAVSGGDQLGALLMAPLDLTPGLRLIVIPHGPLHYLPFQALRLNNQFMIERDKISVAPSITIAAQLAAKMPRSEPKLLAFGNPLIEARFDLPGSEREVDGLSAFFPDKQVFLRADATKTRFKQAAGSARIVHIAAHAEADTVDPLYSRILLANENGRQSFLEAHEVLGIDLSDAALVTLSACESGLGRIDDGDEMLGFTRSFLSAGTSSLIASLWPVSDDAADIMMTTLYRELAGGTDLQSAMQSAQLAVLHTPKMQHPFFWAPFNLIGNWRLTVGSGPVTVPLSNP
jgi:CHAT domain-containing protein